MQFLLFMSALLLVHSFKLTSFKLHSKHLTKRGIIKMAAKVSASDVLASPKFPDAWPYTPRDFSRQDESVDASFYAPERLLYHIDDGAVQALTKFYVENIKEGSDVLDIASSWVSHYPKGLKLGRVSGLGMNEQELSKNSQLSDYCVKDLNTSPVFPYDDSSFDVVTCVVSVDYLNKPLEVFKEIARVLKPNGVAIISQSNRCFPTKAINIWLNTNDLEHIFIIGSYFHYSNKFMPPQSIDISPGSGDPMFIIQAVKK